MRFSAAVFERRLRERLEAESRRTAGPTRSTLPTGWDAARVSEYLRQQLDSQQTAKPRAVILGAGGHAKVIIEILEEAGEFEIVGCTATGGSPRTVLSLPVLGDDSLLPQLYASSVRYAFAAIGDNRVRLECIRNLTAAGFHLINAVSRRATVSARARLGHGVAVMPGAVVNVDAEIHDGVIVNTGATVDHDCRIGPCAHVAPGTNVAGCVTLGEGAFLGAGSRVIDGISIGAWSVAGAGAVVIRNLPERVIATGIPAVITESTAASRVKR